MNDVAWWTTNSEEEDWATTHTRTHAHRHARGRFVAGPSRQQSAPTRPTQEGSLWLTCAAGSLAGDVAWPTGANFDGGHHTWYG